MCGDGRNKSEQESREKPRECPLREEYICGKCNQCRDQVGPRELVDDPAQMHLEQGEQWKRSWRCGSHPAVAEVEEDCNNGDGRERTKEQGERKPPREHVGSRCLTDRP